VSAETVLVIGCGVSGLTCAVRLLEEGRPVAIQARDLPPHTTSNVAAAFWYPYRAYPKDRVSRWARTSLERFRQLADNPDTGIVERQAIEVFRRAAPDPWWGPAVRRWRRARAEELPVGYVDGYRFAAPVIDTRRYLPWLMDRVRALGGSIEQRPLADLDQAVANHALVVNCSGLGARELISDTDLVPIRGEVVRVANPGLQMVEIDHDLAGEVSYVIPRGDDCVLGGSAEEGREDTAPDPSITAAILDRCQRLQPRLAGATARGSAVGLRPGRTTVRLEVERPAPGKLVVHNYGHGGAGVTLSWGCAEEVVELIGAPTKP
jgi:D-amino-acid oxidase